MNPGLEQGAPRQLVLPFVHRATLTRDTYIAAPCNAEALAWLDQPLWPEARLAIWGEAGSGKSHLARIWAGERDALQLDGGSLRGLAALTPPAPAIAVDDADLVADERDLLHLINTARDRGAALLLTGRTPPSRWRVRLPDLGSRLRATACIGLGRPDDALLRALFLRLLEERQLAVPLPVVDWLLPRLPRSPAVLREAAARLDRAAFAQSGAVTRALAAAVFAGWNDVETSAAEADPARQPLLPMPASLSRFP